MNTQTAAEKTGVSISTIRRWCRTGRIQATKLNRVWTIDPASLPTQEDVMEYELTEFTHAINGSTVYAAMHTATGQRIDSSSDRAEMQARVDQLNAGRAYRGFTAEHRPAEHRAQKRVNPTTSCHFCGLDSRRCDCN